MRDESQAAKKRAILLTEPLVNALYDMAWVLSPAADTTAFFYDGMPRPGYGTGGRSDRSSENSI